MSSKMSLKKKLFGGSACLRLNSVLRYAETKLPPWSVLILLIGTLMSSTVLADPLSVFIPTDSDISPKI